MPDPTGINNMSEQTLLSLLSWRASIYTAIATIVGFGLLNGYLVRSRINHLRKQGVPMPKWSWIGGHLLVFRHYLDNYPPDTFVNIIVKHMAKDLGNPDIFYLDLWPFLAPTLVVCNPEAATQVSNKLNLPKPPMYKTMFDPMNGGPSILTMNGKEWKYWRTLFNPGFAPGYLLEQVPEIVDSVEIFCNQLKEREGTVFRLEEVATKLTMEVIMKSVLDLDLDYQRKAHPLADALRTMISWTSFGNPFNKYHPIRPLILRYYGNIMNNLIRKELVERCNEYNQEKIALSQRKKSKSVIALTLETYLAENQREGASKEDQTFIAYATYQIRLFLSAGHDTTTSVLVYVYHMLHKHPAIRTLMMSEHDSVFGPDLSTVAAQLRSNPTLINQTSYTLAVIKETMRLYPPAGGYRLGGPGITLVDEKGLEFPTQECLISLVHHAIHVSPRVWLRAEEFLPERWLVEAGHELSPPNGAFRSFEQGPRNCIGQDLSLIELRIALVMTVRMMRIRPAYEKWDALKKGSLLGWIGFGKGAKNTINGDRAYQIEKGGAHPANGYPCIVEIR